MNTIASRFGYALFLITALTLGACAIQDRTSLDASWSAPDRPAKHFKKVLVITVARDEFVQQELQDMLAKRLQSEGMNAVASHRYFTRYVPEEKERFREAIESSDADAVFVLRATFADTESRTSPDYPIYTYPTNVRTAPDYTLTELGSEATLFARKGQKRVWSARLHTENAGTGDRARAINQYIDVLVAAMKKDKVF
ncbi:MAG: hypothetical protein K2Y35_15555 [Burkholderiales bacterium]|nr:hypothetical protein [Burkholderiales bacterium]